MSVVLTPNMVWRPPTCDLVNNFDRAFCNSTASVSLIEWEMVIFWAKVCGLTTCSALVAESLAAQLALSIAHCMRLKKVIIKGDSMVVITVLKDGNLIRPWTIANIILDCHALISLFVIMLGELVMVLWMHWPSFVRMRWERLLGLGPLLTDSLLIPCDVKSLDHVDLL